MGNLKCSCVNNNDNGQFVFESVNNNPEQNKNISLFEKISIYYNSKNIEVQKFKQDEFFEILNSNSNTVKILEEYEEVFDKSNIKINQNSSEVESIKFIDNNENNYLSEYFYFGEFNDEGIINGVGIKIIKTNNIYKGEFSNGKYHGKGLYIKNGSSIFGDWEYGEIKGNVIYKINSKFEYTGNFKNYKKNGFGTEKYPDGSQYEGNFINNKKCGQGIFNFPNKEYYDGNFENDLYNGEGQYVWGENNRKFIGEFKRGKIEGKGTYIYEDGTIFKGTFSDAKKNGEGCIEFPNGNKYFGNWLNDELYGNGYLINGNKIIEIVFRHGKIISQRINEDFESNINDNIDELSATNNVRFSEKEFYGDKNNIKLSKYICQICKYFFLKPLKCSLCYTNFCEECVQGNKCLKCNNDKFNKDNELYNEMIENIMIKCDKCQKIIHYGESFCHYH